MALQTMPKFKVSTVKTTPDVGYISPRFVCPKCGHDETNRTYEPLIDHIFVSCTKCAYARSQPCLDAQEGDV